MLLRCIVGITDFNLVSIDSLHIGLNITRNSRQGVQHASRRLSCRSIFIPCKPVYGKVRKTLFFVGPKWGRVGEVNCLFRKRFMQLSTKFAGYPFLIRRFLIKVNSSCASLVVEHNFHARLMRPWTRLFL